MSPASGGRAARALAALLLLAAVPARSQTPAADDARDTAWIALALDAPCPSGRVRLHLVEGRTEEGRCGAVMDGRLVLRDGAGVERAVPLAGIRSVWVQERQTMRTGARGAVWGAGAMALVGIFLVNSACETNSCSRDYAPAIIASSPAGGAGGFLVGAVAGYTEMKWKRRYP